MVFAKFVPKTKLLLKLLFYRGATTFIDYPKAFSVLVSNVRIVYN